MKPFDEFVLYLRDLRSRVPRLLEDVESALRSGGLMGSEFSESALGLFSKVLGRPRMKTD